MNYQPLKVPSDVAELPFFLQAELARIAQALQDLPPVPLLYTAPVKPQAGMFVRADGTLWNPGNGAGLYYYNGTTWVFVA